MIRSKMMFVAIKLNQNRMPMIIYRCPIYVMQIRAETQYITPKSKS